MNNYFELWNIMVANALQMEVAVISCFVIDRLLV